MNDSDKVNVLAGILDQAASLIRSLAEELSQYRAVDQEESFLSELEDITGRLL